ncbi:MAG: Wzz/FepE/Etk N-terminal domain-containing protein [Lachnospiraceae bacterium]|nr:Wzz/FepE/Etk N-terminal domain-containing protein [Lachnospiraceae bacterium]
MNERKETTQMIEDDAVEIDLVELFYYLRHKLIWLILVFLLGGTITGLISYYLVTPKYEATAKVYMVSASTDSLINLSDLNLGTSLSEDYEEMLRIRPVYEKITEELKLDYDYEDFLKLIDISTVGNTRVLQISVETKDPEESKNIANLLADHAENYLPDLMETSEPNVAEYAILPEKPSSPDILKNTIIGAFVALLLLGGSFTVRFVMDDTFKSAEDVDHVFGIMPLTVIPESDSKDLKGRKRKKKKNKKQR